MTPEIRAILKLLDRRPDYDEQHAISEVAALMCIPYKKLTQMYYDYIREIKND